MTRLNSLSATPREIIVTMADGNPGAVSVMMQMFEAGDRVDPDSALGGLGAVMFLDTLGIYGSRIWMLHKDVCGGEIEKTLGALRAVQLGLRKRADLDAAIDGDRSALDIDAAMRDVKQRLPAFASA